MGTFPGDCTFQHSAQLAIGGAEVLSGTQSAAVLGTSLAKEDDSQVLPQPELWQARQLLPHCSDFLQSDCKRFQGI